MIYDAVETESGRDYDAYGLHDLEDTCRRTFNALRQIANTFDSIIVTGMSGVVVGVPVAMKLKKPVVIVRKDRDRDDSHQGPMGGGVINRYGIGKRALFLDDFSATGDTEARVMNAAESLKAEVVASYWYRDDDIVHHRDES